jgi:glucokinase
MILAGDVGGTNTRLALARQDDAEQLEFVVEEIFPSTEYQGVDEIAKEFLSRQEERPQAACLAVAGPVNEGRCQPVNLPWVVDERELSELLGIDRLVVINDLEANAYGIACLTEDDIDTINEGVPNAKGNIAVVSPGTGLGEAGMYWDGRRHHPFATEGGHTEFAPRNKLEIEFLEYLMQIYTDHVSPERVVSGPGFMHIYEFLRDTGRGEEPNWLTEQIRDPHNDPAVCVTKAALAGRSPLCEQTLDLFIELLGVEAGSMALKVMARGGVWLGGGIIVKILDRVKSTDHFMKGFTNKGRVDYIMHQMPVRAILNDKTALLGAARHAFDSIAP